jgi:hypothetical protein
MPDIAKGRIEPSLNELIRTGNVCRDLRSKKLFYQTEEDASEVSNAGPFWCARTQSLIGPDGQVAGHTECRPGRGCCSTT